ncbi:MAG: DUF86 domain-containing protein [Pseudanabaena sp.]|jgi:uncharacterized protein with HEPN domain|uniref:HepT-like ribonuclease domain-containing protein n=1 Tax=Pseudanabaena mucicola TaxID=71190 RepID=UPI00257648E1|nr:HepT-like ribonuclease domain-containing protein [Pseudanabaena mucicola]MCA6574165.1 DUF86 domain-containing protein [Pseudanabaena sp. M53BS1SP1A06MG]MCA6581855.1 DUF86 domain-containing protein [Pseudanabaena sp. M34BS1SP1A06MG]MCA6587133.1 DUF86 domain-containing protein [Pseudanabaena sp. M051S1SP1A06QC]MCA6590317.1 DUF86 domain-containing protein [Pseudanabaena sp. M109S1SP1A06QC]MCA6592407.1 DUF86 domain-containing protein [Pseudanabaena sp. M38BS1SP1A06MG]MCA6596502.1 DUF86 domain-
MGTRKVIIPAEININHRLEVQIQDILEALTATESFVAGIDFLDFSCDQKTIFAVERAISIIGATAKRLPISFIDQYPEINWRSLTSIGDNLMFSYLEVDLNTLWNLAQQDVPFIKEQMKKAIANL